MIDKGSYIKGYAEGYGKIKGYVISASYANDLRVVIHKPKAHRGKAVWVHRYGTVGHKGIKELTPQ